MLKHLAVLNNKLDEFIMFLRCHYMLIMWYPNEESDITYLRQYISEAGYTFNGTGNGYTFVQAN